jgi:hypothetical protein
MPSLVVCVEVGGPLAPQVCHLVGCAPMRLILLALTLGLMSPAIPASADTTLQNDGFASGQNAVFQGGFSSGEIGAVRLSPPGTFTRQLKEVQFLFGGAGGQTQVLLRIYDDSAGTLNPGTELFSHTYLITASSTALQSIDLTAENIVISGDIRVGVEMVDGGLPSIARDDDGTIDASVNFILASGLGWAESNTYGLTGDWIIRAVVSDPLVPALPVTWGQLKQKAW